MPPTLAVILILGLGLSQRTSSQKQMLSKPAIWVKPSFMIPNGTPAAIGCRGAGEAEEYHLYFERGPSALERPTSPLVMNWVKFPIPAMTLHTAGRYRCSYRSGAFWSELSDPLELVVTGLYDTPTLSVEPGSEVTSGENVIFRCQLATATSRFFLLKAGRSSRPQLRYGNLWAEFHLGPVTPAHRGTYRCFGSYNNHVWSFPSKPVKLLVKGDAGNTTFAPTEHTSSDHWDYELTTGTQSQKDHFLWNHMAQNLIRLGLAVLVLAALVGLLLEDWLHRSKPRETDHRASRRGHRRRLRAQRALETRPRDAAATGGAESSPDMGLWELHVEPKEEGGRCRELREDCMQLGQKEMKTARFPADQAHCLFQV